MKDYRMIVMMLAFLVHFLLLLGTNRLCGSPPAGLRAALGAALAAVHAGLSMLSGFSFLGAIPWRLIFLVLSALLAFGMERSALKKGMVFGLLSLAMEGITTGGGWAVILAALVIFLLCQISRQQPSGRYVPVVITHGGQTMSLMALPDNGNTLLDPISGAPVLIVGREVAYHLLGLTDQQLARPIETLAARTNPGLRLIPYCAVGTAAGLLLGCRVDRLQIDGKDTDAIVAFAPQNIGHTNSFQALAGGNL